VAVEAPAFSEAFIDEKWDYSYVPISLLIGELCETGLGLLFIRRTAGLY